IGGGSIGAGEPPSRTGSLELSIKRSDPGHQEATTMTKEMRWRIMALQAIMVLVFGFCAGFLYWGSGFVNGMVHDQLAAQQIFFPAQGSAALKALPAQDAAAMQKYAGQQLTTGDQAQVYSEHFIGVHLKDVAGG